MKTKKEIDEYIDNAVHVRPQAEYEKLVRKAEKLSGAISIASSRLNSMRDELAFLEEQISDCEEASSVASEIRAVLKWATSGQQNRNQ